MCEYATASCVQSNRMLRARHEPRGSAGRPRRRPQDAAAHSRDRRSLQSLQRGVQHATIAAPRRAQICRGSSVRQCTLIRLLKMRIRALLHSDLQPAVSTRTHAQPSPSCTCLGPGLRFFCAVCAVCAATTPHAPAMPSLTDANFEESKPPGDGACLIASGGPVRRPQTFFLHVPRVAWLAALCGQSLNH